MIADVTLDASGRIVHLGGEVHACAMGQASAAIVMRHATGRTQADFGAVREALGAYLTGEAETVSWPELSVFAPARGRPARHAAILLPFDATLAAIEAAA